MKITHPFVTAILLTTAFVVSSLFFQNCKPDECDDEETGECDTCITVYKPNIYIYPEEKTRLEVTLGFPKGGNVVTSIPEYGRGWSVSVDKNGMIDNKYGFLFYESTQPDVWQMNEGWIVKQAELQQFFFENMTRYGFKGREIEDFIDYWIPRLNYSSYFEIYPQTQFLIESVIQLNISKKPDNLLRLFYVIKPMNIQKSIVLKEPKIEHQFIREGFVVTEWGVVLK